MFNINMVFIIYNFTYFNYMKKPFKDYARSEIM